jgi:lycopene cyclase domain-containing protein
MEQKLKQNYNYIFFFVLLIVGLLLFHALYFLPAYTKLAIVFLILPSIFVLCRKQAHIDRGRIWVTLVLAILAGIVWDNIAIAFNIWNFPKESVSGWLLGVPLEEYVFAIFYTTVTLGIYTALPHFQKYKLLDIPKFKILPLLASVFILQTIALYVIFFSNTSSYVAWLLVLAVIPSIFFAFRRGERVDMGRMLITAGIMAILIVCAIDGIFIPAQAWVYNEHALLGKIGTVPIDDILFAFFNAIIVVGFYTSLPHKHPLTGKWQAK